VVAGGFEYLLIFYLCIHGNPALGKKGINHNLAELMLNHSHDLSILSTDYSLSTSENDAYNQTHCMQRQKKWWPQLRSDQWLIFSLWLAWWLVLPWATKSVILVTNLTQLTPPPEFSLMVPAPIPLLKNPLELENTDPLAASVSANNILVIDLPSAAVLYQRNSEFTTYPASTTKLMTALVAQESFMLDQKLVVGEEATASGNLMGLEVGEEITVRDLLKGLLIQSGNDAGLTLARSYLGGEPAFIAQMNQTAVELGLGQTNFTNSVGYDGPAHLTTARDLATLSQAVMSDPFLKQVVGTQKTEVQDTTGQIIHPLVSTNALLNRVPGVVGIKTGTTTLAGEVLITQFQLGNRQLLVVVMGSQDRYRDTEALLKWTLDSYEWHDWTELARL
jgi:D-alanyl-D-alanine carboxypeptidase